MLPIVMGMESELSLSPLSESLLYNFAEHVDVPYLFSVYNTKTDIFLANGARMYVDCHHLEYSTAECLNPRDVALSAAAGLMIAGEVAKKTDSKILRHNVDYQTVRTWGCHESYMMRSQFSVHNLPEASMKGIIAFLASRVCYGGSGGISHRSLPIFSLSPRLMLFDEECGESTTSERALLNIRDESLGKGVRLHVICGDMLASSYATWLRVGATALVIRMYDAGAGPKVALAKSLEAMKAFVSPFSGGKLAWVNQSAMVDDAPCSLSAMGVQRVFLNAAKSKLNESWMPDWAGEVVNAWSETLDALESHDMDWLARRLDWATKWLLAGQLSADMGLPFDVIDDRIGQFLKMTRPDGSDIIPDQELINLRNRLCEMDMRFGQVGGIADEMSEYLEYDMFDQDEVAKATSSAPEGRARARGEEIRRLAKISGRNGVKKIAWSMIASQDDRYAEMIEPSDGSPVCLHGPIRDDAQIWPIRKGRRVILRAYFGGLSGGDALCQRYIGETAIIEDSQITYDKEPLRRAYVAVAMENNPNIRLMWRVQSMTPALEATQAVSSGSQDRPEATS